MSPFWFLIYFFLKGEHRTLTDLLSSYYGVEDKHAI